MRTSSNRLKTRIPAAACLLLSLCFSVESKAEETTLEFQVKAGYLFNFTKFVDWPKEAFRNSESPIVVTIFGEDPFGPQFDEAVRGETTRGRPIVIKRSQRLDDLPDTHILYICKSESHRTDQIVSRVGTKHVLTVGESSDLLRLGGVIRFVLQDGKVRFIINADAERKAGLTIGAQLKRLASSVLGSDK